MFSRAAFLRFGLSVGLTAQAALGTGCHEYAPHTQVIQLDAAEWISGPVDLKKLTVVVAVEPPKALKEAYETIAARADSKEVESIFRSHAQGGHGSGVVMVRQEGAQRTAYVVTNRHVVADSDTVEIRLADGTTYRNCQVLYASKEVDVAVVALPETALSQFPFGVAPSSKPATERGLVVATGYPGVGGVPSFQMTEGRISNANFNVATVTDGGRLLQHTAAIDPGSSGGPLTSDQGELVGLNVAIVRGRQAFNLSVPVADVVATVRQAAALKNARGSTLEMTRMLEASCGKLAAEFGSNHQNYGRTMTYISNDLVAREGFNSFANLQQLKEGSEAHSFTNAFVGDPLSLMRISVLVRLVTSAKVAGVRGEASCTAVNPSDEGQVASGQAVRMGIRTPSGQPMDLQWVFEHGNWRVQSSQLVAFVADKASEKEIGKKGSKKDATKTKSSAATPGAKSQK
jgi:serine protease Do